MAEMFSTVLAGWSLAHANERPGPGPLPTRAVAPAGTAPDDAPGSPVWPVESFGVQYWGESYEIAALAAAPHALLIMEPSRIGADAAAGRAEILFSTAEVAEARQHGKREVLGYMNVGELAPYRDYWDFRAVDTCAAPADLAGGLDPSPRACAPPPWFGTATTDGEWLAAFWTTAWQDILHRRVDALLARAYDGVFLDDVLHYFTWSSDTNLVALAAASGGPTKVDEAARAMLRLVSGLARYARVEAPLARPDFKIVVNGAPYIGYDAAGGEDGLPSAFEDYRAAVDAILLEGALTRRDAHAVVTLLKEQYLSRGIAVLTIEFAPEDAGAGEVAAFRCAMATRARRHGFTTYVARDHRFDRLEPPLKEATEERDGCGNGTDQ